MNIDDEYDFSKFSDLRPFEAIDVLEVPNGFQIKFPNFKIEISRRVNLQSSIGDMPVPIEGPLIVNNFIGKTFDRFGAKFHNIIFLSPQFFVRLTYSDDYENMHIKDKSGIWDFLA